MEKKLNIIYLLFFLIILIIPLCLTNTENDVTSDFDNRVLMELPEIGEMGFEQKFTSYLQDRIGLRDQIVTGYQLLNYSFAGELTHPNYTYGQDGHVFFNMHNNVQYGTYHKIFAEAVLKMQLYCESRGVKFYFVFDPEKSSVYRRYLPTGVKYNDEWVDELFMYMRSLGIRCINNRDLLIEHSEKEQVFNRQFDAGHWNDLGCFYATNNLWKEVHLDYPNVTEYSDDDFYISTTMGEYLAASKYPVNEEVPAYVLKTELEDKTNHYSGIKLNKSYPFFQYYINESGKFKTYPRMLVFNGSYYIRGPQFFAGRASEYIGVHDYQNVLNLDYYVNVFQPDLVIFEVAEYTLSDDYFDSGIMAGLDYNPSLIKEDNSVETAIESVKNHSEEYKIESGTKLCIIQHDGFDTVYLEEELSNARYVYLFRDGNIFDLQRDDNGFYCTGIPHGAIMDKATLYYEDYAGNAFFSEIDAQYAISYLAGSNDMICSDGAIYHAVDNQYKLVTTMKDNVFNSLDMQLLDEKTREYLELLLSETTSGVKNGFFVHKRETGWYYVRLVGNSNKKDESIDVLTYLIKGKKYYYSIDVTELTEKRIQISDYKLFGPCTMNFEKCELVGRVGKSEGTTETSSSRFTMMTELKNNIFNSVVLQLNNTETGKYIDPISVASETGVKTGRYYHNAPTGKYFFKLRANSNLMDEYIGANVELQQYAMYEWTYDVELFGSKEIVVKDFSLKTIGVPVK